MKLIYLFYYLFILGILLIEDNLILKTKAKEGLNFDSLWTDRSVITGTTSIGGGLRAK